MKIKLFSFVRKFSNKNINYDINCNRPIKNADRLPTNYLLIKKENKNPSAEAMAKIIKYILDSLREIEKGQKEIIEQLKNVSRSV